MHNFYESPQVPCLVFNQMHKQEKTAVFQQCLVLVFAVNTRAGAANFICVKLITLARLIFCPILHVLGGPGTNAKVLVAHLRGKKYEILFDQPMSQTCACLIKNHE